MILNSTAFHGSPPMNESNKHKMKYDISKNKIKLHESLSLDVIGELKAIMDEEFPKKSKKWVVDLKEVNSIDTAAIQFCVILKKNLENQGKNVQFMNLSESLQKDIELLSLEGFINDTSQTGEK